MKPATLNELKKELHTLAPAEMLDVCMRLVKYKKENKELLNYLLFEAHNEQGYVDNVKAGIDTLFEELSKGNLYLATKSLRKILRFTNKYIKYSGSKQTETELLIYFCIKLRKSGLKIQASTALTNLYQQQLKKIEKSLSTLHEDLQFDYRTELERLY